MVFFFAGVAAAAAGFRLIRLHQIHLFMRET